MYRFFFSSRHRLGKPLLPVNSKMSWKRQVFANYHIIFYIIINIGKNITFYYINTNEIPAELSRKNFRYLHMWKYHRCHGFTINRAFHTKSYLSQMVLYFVSRVFVFVSRVEKNISRVSAANEWNIFQHSKRNFVSPRGHVISSINGKNLSV